MQRTRPFLIGVSVLIKRGVRYTVPLSDRNVMDPIPVFTFLSLNSLHHESALRDPHPDPRADAKPGPLEPATLQS